MAALIELSKASLSQRNLTRDFLTTVIHNCKSDQHYRIVSNPRQTAAVHNISNPPGDLEISQLSERLNTSATFELIRYRESSIPTITANGLIITPMIDITHLNPRLLPHALKQEEAHGATDTHTLDLRAWTHLPEIIKNHWRRFNHKLKAHIMHCMTRYLEKQPELRPSNLDFSSTLFATTPQQDFPHIPVKLPLSDLRNNHQYETRDLMDVLVSPSIDRVNFNQLMPATKATDELKFRLSSQNPTMLKRI